jgi:hypothetical protein
MGSLRLHSTFHGDNFHQAYQRLNLKRLVYALSLFMGLVTLTNCVPATQQNHLEFFFSEDVWGGSPFDEAQKKQLFVAALKTRDSERISQDVPFEINDASVIVKRFTALYEVDANIGLPKVRSGYVLELALGSTPPERVTLINTLTGVSWAIKLTPSPLVTESN